MKQNGGKASTFYTTICRMEVFELIDCWEVFDIEGRLREVLADEGMFLVNRKPTFRILFSKIESFSLGHFH